MAASQSPAELPAHYAEDEADGNHVLPVPSSQSRLRERRQTPPPARRVLPPRPCMPAVTASIMPLASLSRTEPGCATAAAAAAALLVSSPLTACRPCALTDGTSSVPSSCGATAEAESRLSTTQCHPIGFARVPASTMASRASLLSWSATTVCGAGSTRASPLMRHDTNALDGPSLLPLSCSSNSTLTLHPASASTSTTVTAAVPAPVTAAGTCRACRDEIAEDTLIDRLPSPHRSSPTGAAPLLCCGPPPQEEGELERRASTAASFLAEVPAAPASPFEECADDYGDRVEHMRVPSQPLTPFTAASCVAVPSSASCEGVDFVHQRHGSGSCGSSVESPLCMPVCSPTNRMIVTHTSAGPGRAAPVAPSRVAPQRRSRSFETPLSFAAGVAGGGCDDHARCYAERRQLSTVTTSTRNSEHARDRHEDPHRPIALMHPSDSAVTLSALTIAVAGTASMPAPSATARSGGACGCTNAAAGALGSPASARACDVDGSPLLAAGAAGGGGLYRTVSCDTLGSVSSTRSRPVLTPAAQGPPVATAAASATTSTTTSVTYTRKNLCLGALDFYGNPVTSLSTLLVQMSMRSGDHDEMDSIDPRGAPVTPFPCSAAAAAAAQQQQHQQQKQQHARNTLSMKNLKAHTQQVGELAPEDKVERFQAKRDASTAYLPTTTTATHTATGTSMTVNNAAVTALPRCRRAYGRGAAMGYPTIACTAVPASGFSTATGPTTTTIATTTTTAAAAAAVAASAPSVATPAKLQVGSLNEVLHECNFLSLNDVLTAIADTHVEELREAQQQLSSAAPKLPGVEGSAGDGLSNATPSGPTVTVEAYPSATTAATSSAVPPAAPPPLPSSAQSASSATVSPCSATVPSLSRRAGSGLVGGGDAVGGCAGTGSDLTCSRSIREGDSGACMCTSGSTTATGFQTQQPPLVSLDPQHALSLAAVITEMSLNIDRSTEASLAASSMLRAASPPPVSLVSRHHASRRASNAADFCTADRTSSAAISVSLPNFPSEAGATGIAVSHPSTIATPTRLRPRTWSTSHTSSVLVDACHAPSVGGASFSPVVAATAPPASVRESIAPVLTDAVSVSFPDDPLERKVLRGAGRENCDEGCGAGGGCGDDPLECGFWGSRLSDRSMHTPPSPPPHEGIIAASFTATATTVPLPASSAPTARGHGRRFVANWRGLPAAEEAPPCTMEPRTLTAAELLLRQPGALSELPCVMDLLTEKKHTPPVLEGVTVCGNLSSEHCGEPVGTGGSTKAFSQEVKTLTTTAGASVSVGEARVVIGSIACGVFDDELTSVTQLRVWARSVACLEHLFPCTDTEVTT